jgi:oligopeptide transport system permease protein
MYMKKNPLSAQIDLSKFTDVTDTEKKKQDIIRKPSNFFKDGMRRFAHNPVAMVSLVVIVIIVLAAIFVPIFWPYHYEEVLGKTYPLSQRLHRWQLQQLVAPFTYGAGEQTRIANGEFVFPHLFGTDDPRAGITSSVSSTAQESPWQSVSLLP